jgi:LmbE family N-acetylglucosaminyl deacetylase
MDLDLTVDGPSESAWGEALGSLPQFRWPDCARLVVVAPHPDDETLGVGGLIATAVLRGMQVVIVSVTDGELASDAANLAATRRAELDAAVAMLSQNSGSMTIDRLQLPDGRVHECIDEITHHLTALLRHDDFVVAPLADDGHSDHEACAAATRSASIVTSSFCCSYPVWAWHCHEPETSSTRRGERLDLSPEAARRKLAATLCFSSQTEGPAPVVPARMLVRLRRSYEVLIPSGGVHPEWPGR